MIRVVLQLRTNGTTPLKVSACFDFSVSTCIWLSLPARLDISIVEFWKASAFFLADQAKWSILRLANDQALCSIVELDPGDTVPPDLHLTKIDARTLPWSAVSSPTRAILLLVQNVLRMARIHQNGGTSIDSIHKATPQMNDNMRHISLHQDTTEAAASPVNAHIKSLRAAFLMLKTLHLLLFIRLRTVLKEKAVGALCEGILTVSSEASDRLNDASSMQLTAAEHKETAHLSVQLVNIALPVMKQLLKDKMLPSTFLHDWNCRLLTSLLPGNSPGAVRAVAAQITSLGEQPLLARAVCAVCYLALLLVTCVWP